MSLEIGARVEVLEPARAFDGVPGSIFTISPRSNNEEYWCDSDERSNRGWFPRESLHAQIAQGLYKVL